ncbi:MAG: AI-2E family transporter [Saprospiraceae bacterium]|nr:AI-2E family transporter [Saprospiraceae bacterium]
MTNDRLIQKYLFLAIIILLGIVIVANLTAFITATLGASIFYILFKKMMIRLSEKYRINKSLGALIIILLSFFIVVLPFTLMGILIANKVIFYINEPAAINDIRLMILEKIKLLPVEIKIDSLITRITSITGSLVTGLLNNIFGVLTTIVVMYFLLYYFLVNYNKLEKTLINYLPMSEANLNILGVELRNMTFINAVGVPVIALAQGLIAYGLYLYAGVQDAGLWAVLTGSASVIPLVGTGIIWVPITVILLAMGQYTEGIVVGVGCLLILGNIDNLIRIFISSKMGDVHPVVTFLGVFLGLNIFGLPGLVFGPLLISYFLLFLKIFRKEYGTAPEEPIEQTVGNNEPSPPQ